MSVWEETITTRFRHSHSQWEGKELYVVLQRVGVPVGTYDEAVVLEEFVIFAKGLKQQEILHSFVEWVFLQSQTNENDDTYCIYTWSVVSGHGTHGAR